MGLSDANRFNGERTIEYCEKLSINAHLASIDACLRQKKMLEYFVIRIAGMTRGRGAPWASPLTVG
jgi:hypothetical protein